MKRTLYSLALTFSLAALIIFTTQGCAKSGDENAAATDSEPEFTITGEAI